MVTQADIGAALSLQRTKGGPLGACLVELQRLKQADLDAILQIAPALPQTIAETGLTVADLLNLTVKVMYSSGEATPTMIGEIMKLSPGVIQQLMEQAEDRRLVIALGAVDLHGASTELRFGLSDKGIQWAQDAMRQNQYVGPAPVTLNAYRDRIVLQRISGERVDQAAIDEAFSDLVISPGVTREVGPAINSGRSILLYGPPGNGKTSIGARIGAIFKDAIYIPYAFEVDGQIIKVFDPGVHRPVTGEAEQTRAPTQQRDEIDPRWVVCRRPLVITGGELTLDMLDLSFNAEAKFYEAPAHVKALGGVFMIDDFGRQLISPTSLLNRWIVPMENRIDYLKVHTGKTFSLPFDELLIFCTNMPPSALMDPAFLRRIPYKIEMAGPSVEEYRRIFHAEARKSGLELPDRLIDYVVTELSDRRGFPLASYQPKFIVDQIVAACRFEGVTTQLRPEFVTMALTNLYTKDAATFGPGSAVSPPASSFRAA